MNADSSADLVLSSRARRALQRGETYLEQGQLNEAIQSFQSVLEGQPDHVPAMLRLAEAMLETGRHRDAHGLALRAHDGALAAPATARRLVVLLTALTESERVVALAQRLPPAFWDSAAALAEVAHALSTAGGHELSRVFARAAVEREPGNPHSLYTLATIEQFLGDFAAAAELAERSLAIDPDAAGAHWLLSRLRLPNPEQRIDRIEQALRRVAHPRHETRLAYALHNELHESGDYPRSFAALERGCRARRATLNYDPRAAAALFDALCTWQPAELEAGDGYTEAELRPVFVIGMHRSGTTLAERMLGGHPQIATAGETFDVRLQLRRASGLHFWGELDPRVVQARHGFDYRRIGADYLAGMRWRAAGRPIVTDKLPSNYLNLGFIARALPQARFICLCRDPLDVGLSSLRTLFTHAAPYSYDQREYVDWYRHYQRLMQHWNALLPDRILHVDYDALVADPAATAQRMAAFCGLSYDPEMVRIERRDQAVTTASTALIRDGIRRDRGQLWKAYERELQPMIGALDGIAV